MFVVLKYKQYMAKVMCFVNAQKKMILNKTTIVQIYES